jgi:hypothetical protein
MLEKVKAFFVGIWDKAKELWGKFVEWLKGIWGKVKDWFNKD